MGGHPLTNSHSVHLSTGITIRAIGNNKNFKNSSNSSSLTSNKFYPFISKQSWWPPTPLKAPLPHLQLPLFLLLVNWQSLGDSQIQVHLSPSFTTQESSSNSDNHQQLSDDHSITTHQGSNESISELGNPTTPLQQLGYSPQPLPRALTLSIPDRGRSSFPQLRTWSSSERGTISPCNILPGEREVPLWSPRRSPSLHLEHMQEALDLPISPTLWQGSEPIAEWTRRRASRSAPKGVRIQTPDIPQCPLLNLFWNFGINPSIWTTHPLTQRQAPYSMGLDLDYDHVPLSLQLESSIPIHNISYPRNALHPTIQISFRN